MIYSHHKFLFFMIDKQTKQRCTHLSEGWPSTSHADLINKWVWHVVLTQHTVIFTWLSEFESSSIMATASIRPVSSRGCRDTVPHPDSVILTEKLGSGTYATVYKGISKV